MSNSWNPDIPTRSRNVVTLRDNGTCVRCHVGKTCEWHHRRSRSVHDAHTHCPCDGVLLCRTCHAWTHAHPTQAKILGLKVERSLMPFDVPLVHQHYGPVLLDCEGMFILLTDRPGVESSEL